MQRILYNIMSLLITQEMSISFNKISCYRDTSLLFFTSEMLLDIGKKKIPFENNFYIRTFITIINNWRKFV